MELSRREKLFYFFPVFFCFCLPFGSLLLSGIIIAWTASSFFNLKKENFLTGIKRPLLRLFYGFFLLVVLSALFSEDMAGSLWAIEIKLSFVLFPYLLFCFQYPPGLLRRCVMAFVSGCFFATVYLVARALIYSAEGHPEYFFYTYFSYFIHASYFAMYLVLAIVFVVLLYGTWFRNRRTVIYSSWFFVAFFITGIFLCASKMGLIAFFVCMPLLLFYKVRRKINLKGVLLLFSLLIVVGWLATVLFPASFARMASLKDVSPENIDKTSVESTAVRILIWDQAWKIGNEHWISGVGAGDANVELYRAYWGNGLEGAYEHRLNAHNEYLQTFVGMGLMGLIPLILLTFGSMIVALRKKHFLLLIFSLLTAMHFMVESMLQASAGVLFFVFFLCFFNLVDETTLKADPLPA